MLMLLFEESQPNARLYGRHASRIGTVLSGFAGIAS
jgi:hypothetical protein